MLSDYRHLPLPDGWEDKTVGTVATVTGGGTPSTTDGSYWNGDIPWATPTDVTALQSKFIAHTATRISRAGLKNSGASLLPPRSLLMTSRATIGACAINTVPMATNQGFANAICNGVVDVEFLYYLLAARKQELTRLASGSTFIEMPKSEFRRIRVMTPPKAEQRKIVAILTAVDEAIERSRAVIEQTRRLKIALLQNLLTHGLPGRHADFRTVKRIGTFPATWELRRLGEMVADLRYGTSTSCATQPEGTPVLRIPNVIGGKVDTSDLKWAILSTAELERLRLDAGDVLIVRTNGNPDYVGRTAIFDRREGDWAFASYLIRVRCNGDRLLPQYLHAYLTTQAGRAELWDGIRTSAGNYNLNSETIKDVRVPTPPIDEQRAIIDLLAAADAKQDQFEGYLSQLINAKTALSQALLMGHKRVHAVTIT